MVKLRRFILPDGTAKLEVKPETPEEIEAREKLHEKYRLRHNKYNKEWFRKKKLENPEYRSDNARRHGFKNDAERAKIYGWNNGKVSPYWINESCPPWLGIHIAENLLPTIFNNPKRMPVNNMGYDWICDKEYKIDVKSSCLHFQHNVRSDTWWFPIRKNKIADIFICIAFDNRKDLNPLHIWIFRGDDKISNRNVNDRYGLSISNCERSLNNYTKYELTDKLDIVKDACIKYKKHVSQGTITR